MIRQPIPKPKLATGPAAKAVLLTTLKSFLRVDGSDEDTVIGIILDSAVEKVEKLIARKLINQTWDIFFDHWPRSDKDKWWDGTRDGAITELYGDGPHLDLPFGPLVSVSGVFTYVDAGTETEFSASNYIVDTSSPSGRISLKAGQVWPATVLRTNNGIKVTAVFGYGAADTDVPSDIKMAIMTLAARMYEHRGDELPQVPEQVMTLLSAYTQLRI